MKKEDGRNYYMNPEGGIGPRSERQSKKKPWYNQRWLLAAVLLIGIAAFVITVSGLSKEVASVNDSIQDQTAVVEKQTDVLVGMIRAAQDVTEAVENGFNRLIAEIHSIAEQIDALA